MKSLFLLAALYKCENLERVFQQTIFPYELSILMEEESCCVYSCDNECLSGSAKRLIYNCVKFATDSLKYVQEFYHTGLLL